MSIRTRQNKGKAKARKELKLATVSERPNFYYAVELDTSHKPDLGTRYTKLRKATYNPQNITLEDKYLLKPIVDYHLELLVGSH